MSLTELTRGWLPQEMFEAVGWGRVSQQLAGAAKYSVYEPIGVETHVIYGRGADTPSSFHFPLKPDGTANFSAPCHYDYELAAMAEAGEDVTQRCTVATAPGDDTGTLESLVGVPQGWAKNQSEPIHFLELKNLGHDDTQKSPGAMAYLRGVLVNTSKHMVRG